MYFNKICNIIVTIHEQLVPEGKKENNQKECCKSNWNIKN